MAGKMLKLTEPRKAPRLPRDHWYPREVSLGQRCARALVWGIVFLLLLRWWFG